MLEQPVFALSVSRKMAVLSNCGGRKVFFSPRRIFQVPDSRKVKLKKSKVHRLMKAFAKDEAMELSKLWQAEERQGVFRLLVPALTSSVVEVDGGGYTCY